MAINRIIATNHRQAFWRRFGASSCMKPESPTSVEAKVRYRSPAVSATIRPLNGGVEVLFGEPQRAVTPGQSVVFYRDCEVIGGGVIEAS